MVRLTLNGERADLSLGYQVDPQKFDSKSGTLTGKSAEVIEINKQIFRVRNEQTFISNRIVIFARDIQNITGRIERTSRLLLQKIRQALGKKPGQFIYVAEFCQFTGLSEEEVHGFLKK
jgi:hypothetical protein